ncbi:MAG: hypothetical protein HWN65_13940 [Candidatus Helarchaeota archaeon]|nr:hypothetical protein [Candidatus Helarchaeota archaeon]
MSQISSNEKAEKYPPWLYFFPMYVVLFSYALFGRIGFILVVDSGEIALYYILTDRIFFPILFLSYWIYYHILSRRFGVYWKDFALIDKILIPTYAIVGILLYLWVEWDFGVTTPTVYPLLGDFVFFFITMPLFLIVFHGINWAICHKTNDRHQYRFFLVVVGTSVVGTITQDWYWWISCPGCTWGPPNVIYFVFPRWIHVPFTPIYVPVIYLIVALVFLGILFLATLQLYSFKQYLVWGACPYLLLVLVGNLLLYLY